MMVDGQDNNIKEQNNNIRDLKPLSMNDDLPIQDIPITDTLTNDISSKGNEYEKINKQQQIADALRKKMSNQKQQQENQQQNIQNQLQIQQNQAVYKPNEEQAQQIQMLSNGIQYLQEELKANQSISNGLSGILGTNEATLRNITAGGLQDIKNFMLGGVEFDLSRYIPLDSSKIKPEEMKLLNAYFERLGIPYNAQKIKVRDILQAYIAMSSDNFHKVSNLDPESLNKIQEILKYRDINSGNFVLTDAELEQIRQSAPDVFNRLTSSGCIQTFKNDLLQNKTLNGALANSLAKAYINDKQERAESSSNTMLGITIASLLLSFSSILSSCGIVLTGFLATVVSFFPLISLAITIYTVVKKIISLANNIESYNNQDKMESVESIGKILNNQSKSKQRQFEDQSIKNKVQIGMIQKEMSKPEQEGQPEIKDNNIIKNEDEEDIETEAEEIDKNEVKNKKEEINDRTNNLSRSQGIPQVLMGLTSQLANLEQQFQENQIKQQNALRKLSIIKKQKKQINKKSIENNIEQKKEEYKNKKTNSLEEILELKHDLMPKNQQEAELIQKQQDFLLNGEQFEEELSDISPENEEIFQPNQQSEFMSQQGLQNMLQDNQQQNKQKEELLIELEEKQKLLQNLLKKKEELEKKQKEQNNNIPIDQYNTQNQSFIPSQSSISFPQLNNYNQQPDNYKIPINPFVSVNHSHYQPQEDMYDIYNPNIQQPICNNQSHIGHQSINKQQQGQGYGFVY